MVLVEIGVFFVTFLLALYYFGIKKYDYFKNTDIKYSRPTIPFLGSPEKLMFKKEHINTFLRRTYFEFPGERYTGLFETYRPMIMIKDPELLKQVGIKEFETFHDHRNFVQGSTEDLFGNNLFVMEGERWREMRAALSPVFTSSKMKNMFVYMEECSKDIVDYFSKQKEIKDKGIIEIDVKDAITRYTNDVIATTAFGLKINSLKEKDNEFYVMGKKASNFGALPLYKFIAFNVFPRISSFLGLTFIEKDVSKFFRTLVKNTMKDREETGVVRHDIIKLLIEAKNGTLTHDPVAKDTVDTGFATVQESSIGKQDIKRKWTEVELAAQAFLFFIGGFETASTVITFLLYELVKNPEVQKKLQVEIDDFNAKSGGKITYNEVLNLKYLDMTTSEILRMWPPLGSVDRVATKPYTLPPPNAKSNKTYTINKGEAIFIPIYGLLHDPQYFPDPEKFDPERFSDENKNSIEASAYLPFGIGPRNCIGSRFALLEIKLIMFHILSKFDIVPTENTQIPAKLDLNSFTLRIENGLFVGLKSRSIKV